MCAHIRACTCVHGRGACTGMQALGLSSLVIDVVTSYLGQIDERFWELDFNDKSEEWDYMHLKPGIKGYFIFIVSLNH